MSAYSIFEKIVNLCYNLSAYNILLIGATISELMLECLSEKDNFPVRADKANRFLVINNSSSDLCLITISISPITTSFNDEKRNVIPEQFNTKCTIFRGVKMVAGKHNFPTRNQFFNHKRRSYYRQMLPKWLGSIMPRNIHKGEIWTKEKQKRHKNALEPLAVNLALLTFTKRETIKSFTSRQNRQQGSIVLSVENGTNKKGEDQ